MSEIKNEFHQFDDPPARPQNTWVMPCLLICGAIVLLIVLSCAGIGYYSYISLRGGVASMVEAIAKAATEQSGLPSEDVDIVNEQIERLGEAARDGALGITEITELTMEMKPPMNAMLIMAIDKRFVDASGLDDEAKAEAHKTLSRFARGVLDEDFSEFEIEAATKPVMDIRTYQYENPSSDEFDSDTNFPDVEPVNAASDQDAESDVQLDSDSDVSGHTQVQTVESSRSLKKTATDEELTAVIEACKKKADEAGIPDRSFQIDAAAELRKVVDGYVPGN